MGSAVGNKFYSFYSFLSPGRSVTERFCVEEITLSEQGKSLSFLNLRNSYPFKESVFLC